MTKNKKKDIIVENNIDLASLVKDIDSNDNIDSNTALAKGILLALSQFDKTSQIGKQKIMPISILSESNEVLENICNRMLILNKEVKRTRSKEYIALISALSKSLGINYTNQENKGMFSRFRKSY